jgi:hypothetical protein
MQVLREIREPVVHRVLRVHREFKVRSELRALRVQ